MNRRTQFVVWFLLGFAIVMLFGGCQLFAGLAEAVGIPVSSGAKAKASGVDAVIGDWFSGWVKDLFLLGTGPAVTEGSRLLHRTHRRRKAARSGTPPAPASHPKRP